MRKTGLLLFVLACLVADTASARTKCKDAWCRWYTSVITVDDGLGIYWPYEGRMSYDRFVYRDRLTENDNTVIVARYARMVSIGDLAYGHDYDLEYYPWEELRVAWQSNTSDARSSLKKIRKFWKKKTLVGQALDVIYEIKPVDGVPVWRVHVRPLNFDINDGALAAGGFLNDVTGKSAMAFALPQLAGTRAGETRTSEWQFCEACIAPLKRKDSGFAHVFVDTQALATAGKPLPMVASLEFVPKVWRTTDKMFYGRTAITGDAALAAAAEVGARGRAEKAERLAAERRKAERAVRYAHDREAYETALTAIQGDSLTEARKRRCGDLRLSGAPNGRDALLQVDYFEDGMAKNAAQYGKHVDCVSKLLADFDYTARAQQLAEGQADLHALWQAAHFDEGEVAELANVESEVDALNAYLRKQADRINGVNRDYDRAWDVFTDARAKRREARIRKETDKCIAALYATQSLTSNSRSYCRNMAERGYTGMGAAAAGYQGNRGGGGTLAYQKPTLPTFDLGGMIANARAVAQGADASALWNADGSIRTERNPDLPAPTPAPVASPAPSRPTAEPVVTVAATEIARPDDAAAVPGAGAVGAAAGTAAVDGAASPAAVSQSGGGGVSITVTTTIPSADDMRRLEQGGASGGGAPPAGNAGAVATASTAVGAAPSSGSGGTNQLVPEQREERSAKYVWVEDVLAEERGFAFSSHDEAVRNLQKAWAKNALTDYCGAQWDGADAHMGVIDVDRIEVERIGSTRWIGSARVQGYCRILSHDPAWEAVRRCVSERRGQAGCAVRERY